MWTDTFKTHIPGEIEKQYHPHLENISLSYQRIYSVFYILTSLTLAQGGDL